MKCNLRKPFRKAKNGNWYSDYDRWVEDDDGRLQRKRIRESTGTTDFQEARKISLRRFERDSGPDISRLGPVEGVEHPTYLSDAIATYEIPGKFGHQHHYRLVEFEDYIVRQHGARLLVHQIKAKHVKRFFAHIQKKRGLQRQSLSQWRSTLRGFFAHQVDEDRCELNPLSDAAACFPKVTTEENRARQEREDKQKGIKGDEVMPLLQSVSYDPILYLAYALAYLQGIERSAIVRLKWKDIDFENNRIFIPGTKTPSRARWAGLWPELKFILLTLRTDETNAESYLLANRNGDQISPNTLYSKQRRHRERTGIRLPKLHDGRHTVGCRLRHDFKWEPDDVRAQMGHKSLATTMKYYVKTKSEHMADKFVETGRKSCPAKPKAS